MAGDMAGDGDRTVGWGVLATGAIAQSFARDLREVPDARLVAVGSRSPSGADRFAAEYGDDGCRAHGSYRALVEDPGVDVVYVATPHALHLGDTRMALEAGKHVLCEKPLTLDRPGAEELFELARTTDRFLMEGMWMACHPVILAVLAGLRAGRFGTPRQVHADLGFVVDRPPEDRLVDPSLGGGALLDMGIYPLALADLVLGPVTDVAAAAALSDRGIDLDVALATRHEHGGIGALTASMTSASPRTATIATDTGLLELPADFHHPPYAVWHPAGGEAEPITGLGPVLGTGLGNEAAEVGRCLAEGLRESPLVPHDRSLRLLGVMDDVRSQIGVRYAVDQGPPGRA